jgi:hypothetical protein
MRESICCGQKTRIAYVRQKFEDFNEILIQKRDKIITAQILGFSKIFLTAQHGGKKTRL